MFLIKFASMASQAGGYGNLMLTLEQQAAFVEEAPEVFLPIPGGWGKMGHTHIRLAASEDVLTGKLRTAGKLRIDKNAKTSRKKPIWRSAVELQIETREAAAMRATRARNINSNKKDLAPEQREELLRALKAVLRKT